MSKECQLCGAPDKLDRYGHNLECPYLERRDYIWLIKDIIRKAGSDMEKQREQMQGEIYKWKCKFHEVRQENNQIRKRIKRKSS